MAKKYKNIPAQLTEPEAVPAARRTASVKPLPTPGPVPVEPIATNIQLTPIVQPVAFVPYSSQKQPLYMYEGEEEVVVEDENEYVEEDVYAPVVAPAKAKKKVSGVSIFLIISSLLILATLIVGKFVSAVEQYTLINDKVGYVLVEELIANVKDKQIVVIENVIPAAVALVGVFALITLIAALADIMRKGASVFAKITVFFTLAFAAVVVVMTFIKGLDKGYGMFIVAGLALLQLLFAYLARREKKVK